MRTVFLSTIGLLIASLVVGQNKIKGTYSSKDYPTAKKIVLKNDSTFYIINSLNGVYQYNDTLSFGKYHLAEDNIIELNSSFQETPNAQDAYVHVTVNEDAGRNPDTLYFIISNSFEEEICEHETKEKRPLHYAISLNGIIKTDDNKNIELFSNEFKIARQDLFDYFSLTVVPSNIEFNGYLAFKTLFSDVYNLKNKEANIFTIDIPLLDVKFMTTKRLYSEYILRENKNIIIWQGEEYKKD